MAQVLEMTTRLDTKPMKTLLFSFTPYFQTGNNEYGKNTQFSGWSKPHSYYSL